MVSSHQTWQLPSVPVQGFNCWYWAFEQVEVFEVCKKILTSKSVACTLWKLVLSCDASEYGIATELAHKFPNFSERIMGLFHEHCLKLNAIIHKLRGKD